MCVRCGLLSHRQVLSSLAIWGGLAEPPLLPAGGSRIQEKPSRSVWSGRSALMGGPAMLLSFTSYYWHRLIFVARKKPISLPGTMARIVGEAVIKINKTRRARPVRWEMVIYKYLKGIYSFLAVLLLCIRFLVLVLVLKLGDLMGDAATFFSYKNPIILNRTTL